MDCYFATTAATNAWSVHFASARCFVVPQLLYQSRPPAASLERCCDSCFNKIRSRVTRLIVASSFLPNAFRPCRFSCSFLDSLLQVLQSPTLNPSPSPPLSRLADSSPVAPPSFEQWQQQEQQSNSSPAVGETRTLTKEEQDSLARQRAGDVTRDALCVTPHTPRFRRRVHQGPA